MAQSSREGVQFGIQFYASLRLGPSHGAWLFTLNSRIAVGFPGSSAGKSPPAMQKTLVRFLCREDLLEKG